MMLNFQKMLLWVGFLTAAFVQADTVTAPLAFYGLSDASAAVFLDDNHFVVANDESNILRTYRIDQSHPVASLDMSDLLFVDPDSPEVDIEAAARVAGRIYWISSHGRNKSGKIRKSRYRFFCTRIEPADKNGKSSVPRLVPTGRPCSTLMHQFVTHPSPIRKMFVDTKQLADDLSKKECKKLAPKKEGLNIEGMVYYAPNQSLLIGLRNPLFNKDKNAIVIELLNPAEVVDEGASAKFGTVLTWDLGKRGIRGIEYNPADKMYYIIGGAVDDETTFVLYQWDGDFKTAPKLLYEWPDISPQFKPEGIASGPNGSGLWFFSDDGTLKVSVNSPVECMEGELLEGGLCPNKFLKDSSKKTFRVQQLDPAKLR